MMILAIAIGLGLTIMVVQLPFAILGEAERRSRLARRKK